eukprot:IDg23013t1
MNRGSEGRRIAGQNESARTPAITAQQLTFQMAQMKAAIVKDVTSCLNESHSVLLSRLDNVQKEQEKIWAVLNGVSTVPEGRPSSSDVTLSGRAVISTQKIPFASELENVESVIHDHMKIVLLRAVYSFACGHAPARQWLAPSVFNKIEAEYGSSSCVSGISIVLFAVQPGDVRNRFRAPVGQAWSSVIRRCLTQRVFLLRKELMNRGLASTDGTIIGWLDSFGEGYRVYQTVSEIITGLEKSGGDSSSANNSDRRSKRRCTEGSRFGDMYKDVRIQAIKTSRASIMRQLTQHRTEIRKQLLSSTEEAYLSGTEEHSLVNVPCTSIGVESTVATDESNHKAFVQLEAAHPWLTVELHYRRTVIRTATDEIQDRFEYRDPSLTFITTERVPLHAVACQFVVAAYKVESYLSVLRSSNIALRAVHVVAIGLRGLLRRSCGLEISNVENLALGEVTSERQGKGGTEITTMFGGGAGPRKRKDGAFEGLPDLAKMRKEKLEASWDEYLEHATAMEEAEQREESSCHIAQNAIRGRSDENERATEVDYDFDSWIGMAGQ